MTSRKRIGTAQGSDDLGEAEPGEGTADIDVIRACGAVTRHHALGLAIWRWRWGGDDREVPYIVRGLLAQGYQLELVVRVLQHLADEACRACEGRGHATVPGTPMLQDADCDACQGTGTVPLTGERERALANRISQLEAETAEAVMRKLGRDE